MKRTEAILKLYSEAEEIAENMGVHYVGTEHLLIAIFRSGSVAGQVLRNLIESEEDIFKEIRKVFEDLEE